MNTFILRYQVSVFGSYDDITPTLENIKFFLNDFSEKNFIPSQVKEVGYNVENGGLKNVTIPRLNLSTADESWVIKFDAERIDFLFTNSDIHVTDVPPLEEFIAQVNDFLIKIGTKFTNKHKRLGLVIHQIFESENPKSLVNNFLNPVSYFQDKLTTEWSSRLATRMNIAEPLAEGINVTNETMWVIRPLQMNSRQVAFTGLQIRTDINTFAENPVYRINSSNALPLLKTFSGIFENITQEITQSIKV